MNSISRKQTGFTIVELLIVIVVIGILAAITIVAFNGVQNRANDTTVKRDLSEAAKQLAMIRVDLERYPTIGAEFATSGFKFSKSAYLTDNTTQNVLYCVNKTTDSYALYVVSKSKNHFMLHDGEITEGGSTNPCSVVGKTWTNDATTAVLHGYHTTEKWRVAWPWTN